MSDLWTVGGGSAHTEPPAEPTTQQPATPPADEPTDWPVPFFGETFHLRRAEAYQWQLLVWADMAAQGEAANIVQQNAATFRLLRAGILEREWPRFCAVAEREHAQLVQDLMPIVMQLHYRATARPTPPPSDSSGGRPATPQSSEVERFSQVIEREQAAGRPDRADIVQMTLEARDAEAGRSET